MHLILTAEERLVEAYGTLGLRLVVQALDELEAARAIAGIRSRRYAAERGLPDMGIPGVAVEWTALVSQLGRVSRALQERGERIDSLLIIGGPQIVPFAPLANPMFDRDRELPTDCVYGTAAGVWSQPHGYGTDWPVGRLPGAAEPTPELLTGLILAAARQHRRQDGPALAPALGYTTDSWQVSSGAVFAEAVSAGAYPLVVSPPTTADSFNLDRLGQARLIYCNLHGVRDGPYWYGQAAGDQELIVALRPQDLAGLNLEGAVVITEACYGARLGQHTIDSSMPLALLARGVVAFVGATVISYGPLQPPSSEADLIARSFLRELRTAATVGNAFLAARLATLRETLLMQGYLDQDDEKTLLGFVLYGDPAIQLGRRAHNGITA